MKLLIALALFAGALRAQNPAQIIPTTVDPTGQTCNATRMNEKTPDGKIYTCQNGHMAQIQAGSAPSTTSITCTAPAVCTPSPITGTGVLSAPTAVVGPASATADHLAVFNGTTGKLIKDGGAPPTIPTIASTTSALKGDGSGNAVAVAGTATNCVLVNGGSSVCTSTANYSQTFTTQTTIALTHNLNTTAVITQCFDAGTPPQEIRWNTNQITDANTVTVTFTDAQSGKCVVTGSLSTVTNISISSACGITTSPNPLVTTGTVSGIETVNAQTGTSYAILNGDCGKLVTQANGSAIADTIAQAGSGGNFAAGWYVDVQNTGVGDVTITPTTSTINGGASLVLSTGQGVRIVSNGTNYLVAGSMGLSGSVINNVTINNSTLNLAHCNKCVINGTEQRTVQAFVLGPADTTSTGNGKYYFVVPATINNNDLTAVRGQVLTAGTTGTTTVALTRCVTAATGNACSGTTAQMLSTNMTIDSGENSTATAATPPVINAANATVTTGQIIRIDISAVSTTPAVGLIISMDFTAP